MKLATAVATVALALAGQAIAADGKAVYDKTCNVCHAAGVANAPKFGDKAAWAPRIATGKDALLASVQKGKGAMPPKAGNAALTDDDIKAAIDFMIAAAK
jgi:cytochrome c5